MAKKKIKKATSMRRSQINRPLPDQVWDVIFEARKSQKRGRFQEAQVLLLELDQRYPNRPEILADLVTLSGDMGDQQSHLLYAERLASLTPNDPEATLVLAGSYVTNGYPILGVSAYRRFLSRWPNSEHADDVSHMLSEMEPLLDDLIAHLGVPVNNEGFEIASLHDEVRFLVEHGKSRQARQKAQQILRQVPDFVPALNNISLSHLTEGNLDQAIATAHQVLEIDDDNFHALANLVRYLCMKGQPEAAGDYAVRLKAAESPSPDLWGKRAEAAAYLGDDQGVLDAFAGAQTADRQTDAPLHPHLEHWAAVATMRQGQEQEARRLWQNALRQAPGLRVAQENLDDLRNPVGKRHAAWPFELNNWLTERAFEGIQRAVQELRDGEDDETLSRVFRRYLERFPELVGLAPILLDRGDPVGREFAFRLAKAARTPEMLAALRDFALSQRGPDAMRGEAGQVASEASLLPSGLTRMWLQGEWRDVLLLGFELHSESSTDHSPEVLDLLFDAARMLAKREGKEAERLLRTALELEPDAPDIQQNLAMALESQGRSSEALELGRQIHRQHPDYVFARIGLVRQAILDGDLDEARSLLEPLLTRKRLHFQEFAVFAMAQIELLLAEDNVEGAKSWLQVWSQVDEGNPNLALMEQRIKDAAKPRTGLLGRILGRGQEPGEPSPVFPPSAPATPYQIGDSIRVKPGVEYPDYPGLDIGGWQGRVTDLGQIKGNDTDTIGFAWDSIALQALPENLIIESERGGYGWPEMYLYLNEIEPASPRDTPQDAEQIQDKLGQRYYWYGIEPDAEHLHAVVSSVSGDSDWEVLKVWKKYLKSKLSFPFDAEVDEWQDRGPLRAGDQVTVLSLAGIDEHYGILVNCRHGRRPLAFPLCDLAAVDEDTLQGAVLRDYSLWFSNR